MVSTNMERIYHYTSIQSLKAILESRKFRFSRLDQLDCHAETQFHETINFGLYFFVSSWAGGNHHELPMWSMYGDKGKGVRISTTRDPFKRYPHAIGDTADSATVPADWITNSDLWFPFSLNDKWFTKPVDYVDDVSFWYKRAVCNENSGITLDGFPDLPFKKDQLWQFQDEIRFLIYAIPKTYQSKIDNIPRSAPPNQIMWSGIAPRVTHIDLELDPEVFEDMEVTLGPLCGHPEQATVEFILKHGAPNIKLNASDATGKIRRL